MLWESLVTDGHVRAARIRRVQPWVIALGLVLIWIGIWIAQLGPDVRPQQSFASLIQERASKLQQHAQHTVEALPALNFTPETAKTLPPQSELSDVVAAIRDSLAKSGDLPTEEVDLAELDADDFWRGDWPAQTVAYVEEDDMYLLGGIVYVGSPSYPQPARWVGLMKKQKSGWEYVTIGGGRLVQVSGQPTAYAGQLPLSLGPFLPKLRDQPQQQ